MGITVLKKADVIRGKKYFRWYGLSKQEGKQKWIYIGKDLNNAETKIKAWLDKNQQGVQS